MLANSRDLRPLSFVSVLQCSPQAPFQFLRSNLLVQLGCPFSAFHLEILQLIIIELFHFIIVIACCWGIHLHDGDVER